MKYYFQALYRSIIDPVWLTKQSREVGKSSIFFVCTVLVLSIGVAVRIAYVEIPRAIPVLQDVLEREVPNFTAQISGGTLSVTDLEQPYVRYFEYENSEIVVVVDTTTSTASLDSFFTSSTEVGFLITSRGIVSKSLNTSEAVNENLTRFPDITISKQEMVNFLNSVGGRAQFVLAVLVTAFTFFAWGIGLLIFIMIFTSIVYGLYRAIGSRDHKSRYTWREVLVFSLYVFALPKLAVSMISFVFPGAALPFVVSIIMGVAVARALGIARTATPEEGSPTISA